MLKIFVDDVDVSTAIENSLKQYNIQRYYNQPDCSDFNIDLDTCTGKVSLPNGYHYIHQIESLKIYQKESCYFLTDGRSGIVFEPGKGMGVGTLDRIAWSQEDTAYSERLGILMYGLMLLMSSRHRILLHSAGLDSNGTGFIFLGHSGSGKSTIALNLLQRHWGILSDDVLILRLSDDLVTASPFRRDIYLLENSLEIFPNIDKFWQSVGVPGQDKKRLAPSDLFPEQILSEMVPKHLVFTRLTADQKSTISPLTQTDAYFLLLEQTPIISIGSGIAQNHICVLQRLMNQCSCHQLVMGADLKVNPGNLEQILNSIRDEALESAGDKQ